MKARILVGEDDATEIARINEVFLPPDFILRYEKTAEKMLPTALSWQPELILLDFGIERVAGPGVLRLLKQDTRTRAIPVFLLSAPEQEDILVQALSQGAVSYLLKPFPPEELLARVRALVKHFRTFTGRDAALRYGPMVLDRQGRQVFVNRRSLSLGPKEFEILEMLMEAAGTVLTRSQILERIWGFDSHAGPRNVDYHVFQLRRKLGKVSLSMDTVSRLGYCFRPESLR
jgi:DNA-binding response OmpR family regulator